MKLSECGTYVCPETYAPLLVDAFQCNGDHVLEGLLRTEDGRRYPIEAGIPDFTSPRDADPKTATALKYWEDNAEDYERYQHFTYETFYQREEDVRNFMIDRLRLRDDASVLEINAGTGRDSILIARRLGPKGRLHAQDLSKKMLEMCSKRLAASAVPLEIHRGNGLRLPYRARTFDAVYSFGGIGVGTYADPKPAIAEMVRVAKVGGRVVFGGASLAPWLRSTYVGKVLTNHNYLYNNEVPLASIPIEARDVNLCWILAGGFFLVDFSVGEGEPRVNLDFEIPGVRGGTLRTRYEGMLEGVTSTTKELAQAARAKLGVSMHAWLDRVVRDAAERDLKE